MKIVYPDLCFKQKLIKEVKEKLKTYKNNSNTRSTKNIFLS